MTALNLSILLSIIFTDVCGDDSNVVDFSHSITVSHCVDSHHVDSQWYTVYNIDMSIANGILYIILSFPWRL